MKVTIVGAGLSGLAAAYFLQEKGINARLIEARSRIGGRIFTDYTAQGTPIEMGATWLSKPHRQLTNLLDELKIPVFEQLTGSHAIYEATPGSPVQLVQLPPNPEPSYRIEGGTTRLIRELARALPEGTIQLNEPVRAIKSTQKRLRLTTDKASYETDILILTLPPYLLQKTINFQPELPASFYQVAEQTHTWMGESIKVGLRYPKPFWQEAGTSGTLFSNAGPVTEMYDHSTPKGYALKGFIHPALAAASQEERKAGVLKQLARYYGQIVYDYTDYQELVWRDEPFTAQPYTTALVPHQNNGHRQFRQSYAKGRIWLAGAEAAAQFSGYMEGAVASAKWVSEQIV